MDKLLKKVCGFLNSKDVELQCAAARVIGEISPKSPEVRLSLAKNLSTSNLTVKNYLLTALENIQGHGALPYLFPLLKEGGKIQERAIRLIASSGGRAVTEIKKQYDGAAEQTKKTLIRILGIIGTHDACKFLFDCIPDARLELSKRICLAFREAIGKMDKKRKRALLKKLNSFLSSPGVKADTGALTAGVILLGYLADAATLNKILQYASPEYPVPVRKHALIGLTRIEIPRKNTEDVAKVIIPMLSEGDYHNVVRNAIEVLKKIDVSKKFGTQMKEALRSSHPAVRSFVLSSMCTSGAQENVESLITHLNSGAFQERRAAQEALSKIPGAYPRIIKELDAAKNYEAGMRLISILRAQRDKINPRDKRRLLTRMEKLQASGDEQFLLYATALKAVAPEFLIDRVMGRVKRLKRAKKFKEAENMLLILTRQMLFTEEVRYEHVVVLLRNSPKDLSPLRRRDDEALRRIGELIRNDEFPLLKRLTTEKALKPADLFYVGFHFSEKLFKHREFGVKLLKHLLKKAPRSQIGRAAKEKLRLVGIKV
jgi:hypothetical protein